MESLLNFFRKLIPSPLFKLFQPAYHYTLALIGAVVYRFPAQKLHVTFITGTKGKTTTTELTTHILETAGYKTAISSTIHIGVGGEKQKNKTKMGTPGRFFLQRHLRRAVDAGCTHAVIEMTSLAVTQYRHKFIAPDALIFTGIHPEHIEAHGSFEKYLAAKFALARALERSSKKNKIVIANADDEHAQKFLDIDVENAIGYKLSDAEPHIGSKFQIDGTAMSTNLVGAFNIMNILAASRLAMHVGVDIETIREAVRSVSQVEGRMQFIPLATQKMDFDVVVDYAHTTGSLEAVYNSFPDKRKICVLGNTGGGRDKWKRPEMASIAEGYCDKIILTNEDPYDEDPREIVRQMEAGIENKDKLEVIMDRREAIERAVTFAYEACQKDEDGNKKCVVLITGKGTDPYIMEANGKKTPWSDQRVAESELEKLAN